MSNSRRRLLHLLPLLLLPLLPASAGAEELPTVDAFATWTLKGVAVNAAPEEMLLVGSLEGPLFIDAGQGPTLAGTVICPGTLTVDLTDASQEGEGVCAFTAKDGAEAYGRWTCSGYHLVGCKGSFTFTGGHGRLEGIAGGSELLIRGDVLEIARAGGQATGEQALGIIVWRGLSAKLPEKE